MGVMRVPQRLAGPVHGEPGTCIAHNEHQECRGT